MEEYDEVVIWCGRVNTRCDEIKPCVSLLGR